MEDIFLKRSWIQDPNDSKNFIEITNQTPGPRVHIHVDNVDYVSPIDGSRLRSNREVLNHNKRHGVSNDLDSLREQTDRANAPKKETRESVHERKLAIKDSMERVSSSGFNRRIQYDE